MRETDAEKTSGGGPGQIDALDAWAMIESSPDGMLLADEHGRILLANTRIELLFGYDRCDLVGRLVEDLIPERHRGPHLAHRTRYRAAPTVRAMGEGLLVSGLRRDGGEFPVEVSLSPIDRDGELRVVATVRDISSRLALDAHSHAVLDTVHAATDGLFMFDPDTLRFEYVNRGAVEQLGYTEAELLGMTPLHVKPEFDRISFNRLLEPLLSGAVGSRTFTTIHRRKDGTDIAVEIIVEYPQARRPGDQRLMVALVRDISERLAAELAYRQTVEAFRVAFHGAPVPMGLATVDRGGVHLSSVNAAGCSLLGYEADELLGRDVGDLVIESDRAWIMALAHKTMDGTTGAGSFETHLVRADGSFVPVWAHSSILEADPDEPTTILTHVLDLTERTRIADERERARLWTESLAEVRAAVLDEQPLEEILTVVCRRARLLTGATLVFVSCHTVGVDHHHRVIASDRRGYRPHVPETLAVDEAARRALAGETSQISGIGPFDEIESVDGKSNGSPRNGLMSGVIVKVDTADDPALLFVVSDEDDGFDPTRIEMLQALARETGTALELARARQELSRLALLEDRERMAHDFHDLVIQRLFAAGMSLHAVQSLTDDEEISGRVGQVITEIDHAITELRSAIFRLTAEQPLTPDRRLADVVVRAQEWLGFDPNLIFQGDANVIPETVLEEMIPTLTEMLSNVARHAEADRVDVVITGEDRRTTLDVRDNGIGFDPDAVGRSGLANLTARAQRLGGACTIVTEPGGGTAVTWRVPN